MSFQRVLWLAGMPRSGTNWVSQILSSCPDVRMKFCPLFSYEFRGRVDERSSAAEWDLLFHETYVTESEYLDQEYLRRDGLVPSFEERAEEPPTLGIKSTRFHDWMPRMLELNPTARLVALVRSPVAAVASWISNEHEFPEGADPLQEWRTGECRKTGPGEFWGFEDWVRTTRMYAALAEEFPRTVRLQRYEDLVADPEAQTAELFRFAELPFTAQTAAFLERSTTESNPHRRAVFRRPEEAFASEAGCPSEIRTAIEEALRGDELERFLTPPREAAA